MPKTTYELEREANIARNRALIEQLELKNAAASVTGSVNPKVSAKPKPPQKPRAKPVQPIKREKRILEDTPRRASARLRKSVINLVDETAAQKRKREQEEEAWRRNEEEERLAAEERAREAKKARHHELDLEVLAGQEEWEPGALSGLSSRLQSLLQARHPRRRGDQDAFVFDNSKRENVEVAALRERLQNMAIVARAKVTQDRVYSAAYHPEPTKDLIFFGDKHGQLGIWDARAPADETEEDDVDRDQREAGKYWRLQVHWPATAQSSISCIKVDPIDAHGVYTSAYDSTVRSLSFTSGISREVFAMEKVLITSMDLPPASHEMWLSDAEGWVTHLDLREDKTRRRAYQVSDQKIGCVSVNPTNPAFILTASNNRALKIWDVRKLRKLPAPQGVLELELEDVEKIKESKEGTAILRGEWKHDRSVTSAYWDPRGRAIVSTSYDDALRIWDIQPSLMTKNPPFPDFRPFARIRHNCQTGKWLTMLKAQWSPNPDVYPHFTIGDMDHSLDIFGWKGDLLAKLSDKERVSATQAVTCSHPSVVERVASGNGSGRCVLWAPAHLVAE
ncbi:WD40 repeat-like protein [Multifurca ochricompacta]|uniref:DNA damage-binding protein CMR1 n=1 Tax=Multifurca ochricompacta TaxID=376703 RepID=A0AAD4MC90_9AGAM|nr:WD40 repeat-like protein [Multifurca ochricompacta]